MEQFINISELVNDGSVWLAIIAINMTIIGLTSLAESKNIIGVDYGKFLIKFYKVIGNVRIYHLLILFAMINVTSLFSMFIMDYSIRLINFLILVLSLVFAIYYFFAYILIENYRVKKQIHISELLGMYYKSSDVTTFEADLLTNMSNGSRTNKRLSTNVINYFDVYNSESQQAFEEVFGPKSILYSEDRKIKNHWKKIYDEEPFDYTLCGDIRHISHEFFQMYRYSELQEKWLLEILNLFNREYTKNNPVAKLDNLIRVMAHINRFGYCDNLFKYKFLEYYSSYIYDALKSINETDIKGIKNFAEKEIFFYKNLLSYLYKTITYNYEATFKNTSKKILLGLIENEEYQIYISKKDKLKMLVKNYNTEYSENVRLLICEIIICYLKVSDEDENFIDELSSINTKDLELCNEIDEVKRKIFIN